MRHRLWGIPTAIVLWGIFLGLFMANHDDYLDFLAHRTSAFSGDGHFNPEHHPVSKHLHMMGISMLPATLAPLFPKSTSIVGIDGDMKPLWIAPPVKNILVAAGSLNGVATVVRYDPDTLDTIWKATIGTGTPYFGAAYGASATSDAVYAIGQLGEDGLEYVWKLDLNDGSLIWSRQVRESRSVGWYGYGIDCYEDGIYVTTDSTLQKYDAEGNLNWQYARWISEVKLNYDSLIAVAASKQGVFIVGWPYDNVPGVNWFIERHNPENGARNWYAQGGGGGDTYAYVYGLHATDEYLAVTGSRYTGGYQDGVWRTEFYDAKTGGQLWVNEDVPSGLDSMDTVRGVAIADLVYAVGRSAVSGLGEEWPRVEARSLLNGSLEWSKDLTQFTNKFQSFTSVTADSSGCYAAGYQDIAIQHYSWWIQKYDPNGNLVAEAGLPAPTEGYFAAIYGIKAISL